LEFIHLIYDVLTDVANGLIELREKAAKKLPDKTENDAPRFPVSSNDLLACAYANIKKEWPSQMTATL